MFCIKIWEGFQCFFSSRSPRFALRTAICHMTVIAVTHVDINKAFAWVYVHLDGTALAVVTSVHLVALTVHPMTTSHAEHASPIPTGTLLTDVSVTTVTLDTTVPMLPPGTDTLPCTHQLMIVCTAILYASEDVPDHLAAIATAVFLTVH